MKKPRRPSARQHRIESEVQRTLALLLPRVVHDPRVTNVTITAVRATADIGTLRVYFLPFGTKHPAAEVEAGLQSAAGLLRGEVGRQLGLRYAPKLEFVHDVELERAEALTRLIDASVAGLPPADASPPDGGRDD